MSWEDEHVYMVLVPQRLGLSELSSLSPHLLHVEASQDSALGPTTLCLPERRDLGPSHEFVTSTPHPSLNPSSLSLSQNQHAHSPAGLISVTCTVLLLLGQLQILVSLLNLFSFPPSSISPKTAASTSFHLSSRHTWPLL